MFAKKTLASIPSTKAIIQGTIDCSPGSTFQNLPNNCFLLVERDCLKLYSNKNLNEPIATKEFDTLQVLGIAPDNSIWISSPQPGDGFSVNKVSAQNLEVKELSFAPTYMNLNKVYFINDKMFCCFIDEYKEEKPPILLILKEENGIIELVQNLDLPIDPGENLRLGNNKRLKDNQFCCTLRTSNAFEVVIFDLFFNTEKEAYELKKQNEIRPPSMNKFAPQVSRMHLLANGDLLFFNPGSDCSEIWNIEKNQCIQSWNWSKLGTDTLIRGNMSITPSPDPTYVLIQTPINSKCYYFNIKNLILTEINFSKYTINAKNLYHHHILANGQLLSPGLQSDSHRKICYDLPQMRVFREQVYKEIIQRLFMYCEVMRKLNPEGINDVNRIIFFYALSEELKRLYPLIERRRLDLIEPKLIEPELVEPELVEDNVKTNILDGCFMM